VEQPGAARPRLEIATPVFEGPLELLLALAERDEIDIFQVSLASLTEAYLAEIGALAVRDPVEMAEFLWLAARLLLLKSIRLLPGEEPDDEEADLLGWEEDVRARLLEYRAYKEMAEKLMERAAADEPSFPVLARVPPRPLVYVGTRWTVEDKVGSLRQRLARGGFDLVEVILECQDRLEAVITFVAVLELLRRAEILVRQDKNFGRILVESR
jgi:segregation and condensation protein A